MDRLFRIKRRRPHLVDLLTPIVVSPGVVNAYRFKWGTNFDSIFTTIITSSNVGYLDPQVNIRKVDSQPTAGRDVRIIFDPTTYSILDDQPFWLQFFPVAGGVEGTGGAPTLVLPDSAHYGTGVVVLWGTAPSGAPLQLDLPYRMQDFRCVNLDGSNNLLVGFSEGSPMMPVLPLIGEQNLNRFGREGSVYVQGDGGNVDFSMSFTLATR